MKLNALVSCRACAGGHAPGAAAEHRRARRRFADADALLPHLPIGLRQACRYACEVLEDDYGLSVMPALALTMLRAHSRRHLVFCARWRIPAYAAALTYCYLSMRGEPLFPHPLSSVWQRFSQNRVLRRPHCERAGGKGR